MSTREEMYAYLERYGNDLEDQVDALLGEIDDVEDLMRRLDDGEEDLEREVTSLVGDGLPTGHTTTAALEH